MGAHQERNQDIARVVTIMGRSSLLRAMVMADTTPKMLDLLQSQTYAEMQIKIQTPMHQALRAAAQEYTQHPFFVPGTSEDQRAHAIGMFMAIGYQLGNAEDPRFLQSAILEHYNRVYPGVIDSKFMPDYRVENHPVEIFFDNGVAMHVDEERAFLPEEVGRRGLPASSTNISRPDYLEMTETRNWINALLDTI